MDINQLIADKVATAQKAKQKSVETRVKALLEDTNFIESQRKLTAMSAEVSKLQTAMTTLNKLPPFIANDGRKFNLNVFSVPFFGIGLGELIGIVQGSRGAFTDELQMQFEAVINVPFIELQQASLALGSPAYYKDGDVFPAVEGDYYELVEIIKSLALKLEIHDCSMEMSKAKYDLWFAKAEATANRKLAEFNKAADLIKTGDRFTLED